MLRNIKLITFYGFHTYLQNSLEIPKCAKFKDDEDIY